MRKLSHQEIVARQENQSGKPRIPLVVVLNNIRSLHNVGSIFRTSDGMGVRKLWLCGITGSPPQSQISKTALGAEDKVEWEYCDDVLAVVKDLKKEGYQIVLLEQMDESSDYHDFVPAEKVCLVVGNEIAGISEGLIEVADSAIDIEMTGIKNSLNVSVAFGVAAYHLAHFLKKK